jgi:hypothetical protein
MEPTKEQRGLVHHDDFGAIGQRLETMQRFQGAREHDWNEKGKALSIAIVELKAVQSKHPFTLKRSVARRLAPDMNLDCSRLTHHDKSCMETVYYS